MGSCWFPSGFPSVFPSRKMIGVRHKQTQHPIRWFVAFREASGSAKSGIAPNPQPKSPISLRPSASSAVSAVQVRRAVMKRRRKLQQTASAPMLIERTSPNTRFIEFPEVQGRTVERVQMSTSADRHSVTINFHDKTSLL